MSALPPRHNNHNNHKVVKNDSGSFSKVQIRNDGTVKKEFNDVYSGMLLKEVSFLLMLKEKVININTVNKNPYFIIPYLGVPLIPYIINNKLQNDKRLIQSVVKQFLIKMIEFDKLGIYHCDLMDKNVLWDANNEILHIIDFGLSQFKIDDAVGFYEIYANYYKDPVRRGCDQKIKEKIQKEDYDYTKDIIFLPPSYLDESWAFGMHIYRMLAKSLNFVTDAQLCEIPIDVDAEWISERIHQPQYAYMIANCFSNRTARLSAEQLIQLMPICTTHSEIQTITYKCQHIKGSITLEYKKIFDSYDVNKLRAMALYINRAQEWMTTIYSTNWVALCVSINMIIKYTYLDKFDYTANNSELKQKKANYMNWLLATINCLTLEMFGDYGLTEYIHKKLSSTLLQIYNDIIKTLHPHYVYFPIYKDYYNDVMNYINYSISTKSISNNIK